MSAQTEREAKRLEGRSSATKEGGRRLPRTMPNHSAKAIANEFLKRQGDLPVPSQMWLQKLVYIAHGWNLAVNGEPLVSEDVEAWDGGPVFRDIWNHVRDYGYDPKSHLLVDPFEKQPFQAELTDKERGVIEHVWNKYRKYSGRQLSSITHQSGTPWTNTYLNSGRDHSIPNEDIRMHYVQLALAGRSAS